MAKAIAATSKSESGRQQTAIRRDFTAWFVARIVSWIMPRFTAWLMDWLMAWSPAQQLDSRRSRLRTSQSRGEAELADDPSPFAASALRFRRKALRAPTPKQGPGPIPRRKRH